MVCKQQALAVRTCQKGEGTQYVFHTQGHHSPVPESYLHVVQQKSVALFFSLFHFFLLFFHFTDKEMKMSSLHQDNELTAALELQSWNLLGDLEP